MVSKGLWYWVGGLLFIMFVVWFVTFLGLSIFAVIFAAIRDFMGPLICWGIRVCLSSSFFSLLIT